MPREPRNFEPGVVYHLISRFVDRRYFVTKQLERSLYLRLHDKALRKSDWTPLGFAIMSNHIHLAARAGRGPIDRWLRPAHTAFADMLNKAHDRIGPIFVRGPKAFAVPDCRVAHLLAYIHNNPVRANVCESAVDSRWTSHRAYVGVADAPRWLDVKQGLELARMTRADFAQFVNDPDQRADRSFSEEAHELELRAHEEAVLVPASDPLAAAIVAATANELEVSVDVVRSKSRASAPILGRAVAVRCSALFPSMSESAIGHALNVSQQRVSVLRRQQCQEVAQLAARVYERVIADVGKRVTVSSRSCALTLSSTLGP